MTIPSSRSLMFEMKSTGSELAFGRLRMSLENFGLLRKTSDFFGNLQKWSCRLKKSQYSQDKNLMLISQKKLAGIRRPYVPTGTMRRDDDEMCWHWTRSTNRVMRKPVKMRGQSKWINRFVVASLKSWWKKKWEIRVIFKFIANDSGWTGKERNGKACKHEECRKISFTESCGWCKWGYWYFWHPKYQ